MVRLEFTRRQSRGTGKKKDEDYDNSTVLARKRRQECGGGECQVYLHL